MKELEELLVIEPMVGYRSWKIYCEKVNNKFNFYLRGSGVGANAGNWQKGINIAKCLKPKTFFSKHQIPEFNCECGFYAHKYKIDIIKELLKNHSPSPFFLTLGIGGNSSNTDLYGIVELTGKVIEHSEGYRAEKAEVKKLIWADERDKISIDYENKDKKVKEKKEEKEKDKNNNIQPKMPTATMAAVNSVFNPFYSYIKQAQVQVQQAQAQRQAQRGLPSSPPIQLPSLPDLYDSKPSETFVKEQIVKSLQDYYKIPIIYYKDYLEKELLK